MNNIKTNREHNRWTMNTVKEMILEALRESMAGIGKDVLKGMQEMQRKQDRAVKRDPNKPKRPKNAYQLWSATVRYDLAGTFSEISKQLSDMWRELPAEERRKFEIAYDKLKLEYDCAMSKYLAKEPCHVSDEEDMVESGSDSD